ncbi:uncharacterized protein RAG0_10326 [Rhynchosporium agropyri]|uniref:F-box domain-containing protein n=1 Tax=Rhynchosporium agropyri TaxID=914238 RepID=A0A1E1KZC7_9HELO|nr:uncharacterized protein RAG0_10326 [Rhynchosporium agropyri]
MSDISCSPLKRRKIKGSSSPAMHSMNTKIKSLALKAVGFPRSSEKKSESVSTWIWPPNQLPVEIFTLIVSYLPRSGVQNMRLVNKEFDRKVSEALFRIVVVPFRPEIYGITPETTGSHEIPHGSVMLQDQGMRVFQGFGRWIKRFAMSFEIDYCRLARPPRKSDQEVILTFWGPYRWPYKTYNRYSQLEGLEQTADETRTMAKALKYICSAKELGLSIDGGLGWLAGPDINQRVAERGDKPVVFGTPKFVPEPKLAAPKVSRPTSQAPPTDSTYHRYLRMVLEAGVSQREADAAVQMLQAADHAAILPGDDGSLEASLATTIIQRNYGPAQRLIPAPPVNTTTPIDTTMVTFAGEDLDWSEDLEEDDNQTTTTVSRRNARLAKTLKDDSLKPNDLTNAQREMLLEMEWAQTAFMQSWAIAIIDNHSTFKGIEKLSIARLPGRHLTMLRREDFWDSLPALRCLSLAVIPDWREVKKEATSWVQDSRVSHSQAVSAVYALFTQQIGRREHIKDIHFEWLCGGEYAPGLFARNQNILAAPVVSSAMNMVNRSQQQDVLDLPHVENLSLKNCWFSPHILKQFLNPMRKGVLQSISFDSVSLTSRITRGATPGHITQGAQNAQLPQLAAQAVANNFVNLQPNPFGGLITQVPNQSVTAPHPNAPPLWLEGPRSGSWADILNRLTPSTTLEDIRYARGYAYEAEPAEPTRLTKLSFESCGYVRVPLDFDQTVLEAGMITPRQPATIKKRITELEDQMMKPLEPSILATIINHIEPVEVQTLENAWNMNVGSWRISQPDLVLDAQLDGFQNAGLGRFGGVVEIAGIRAPSTRTFF